MIHIMQFLTEVWEDTFSLHLCGGVWKPEQLKEISVSAQLSYVLQKQQQTHVIFFNSNE